METNEHLLQGYSDSEKGAYLGAIASIATADHEATDDELEFINELSSKVDLSQQQTLAVQRAAKELTTLNMNIGFQVGLKVKLVFANKVTVLAFV